MENTTETVQPKETRMEASRLDVVPIKRKGLARRRLVRRQFVPMKHIEGWERRLNVRPEWSAALAIYTVWCDGLAKYQLRSRN